MSAPAGWYPDPSKEPQLRFWDGNQWSAATQPYPANPATGAAPATFGTTPGAQQTGPATRAKRTGLKVAGLGCLGIVVLFVIIGSIIAAISSSNSGSTSAVSASESPSPREASPSQSPTASATATQAKSTPPPPPAPAVPTQTLSGTGDDVQTIDLKGNPAIIAFSCPACASNTVLKTNGADSLLVNVIGPYSGAHIVDTSKRSNTSQLTIKANSPWTITISDISTVKKSAGPVSGHGDDVIYLSGNTSKATIVNTGQSNFVVMGFGASFPELAVNEIGSYKGTVPLTGPGFVQVESDGDWSISPQ